MLMNLGRSTLGCRVESRSGIIGLGLMTRHKIEIIDNTLHASG